MDGSRRRSRCWKEPASAAVARSGAGLGREWRNSTDTCGVVPVAAPEKNPQPPRFPWFGGAGEGHEHWQLHTLAASFPSLEEPAAAARDHGGAGLAASGVARQRL